LARLNRPSDDQLQRGVGHGADAAQHQQREKHLLAAVGGRDPQAA
jgi:hypothetical protein